VNKEGLFRAVLDRYISRFAAKHEALLFDEEKKRRSGVARLLHRRRHLLYQQRNAGRLLYDQYLRRAGGLLTDIANTIKSRHAMQEQTLTQFLQQRQLRGELPPDATCASWRSF
jgi:AcrR family transcriptional regulator